jgi:WXG100 family type VII secretion target
MLIRADYERLHQSAAKTAECSQRLQSCIVTLNARSAELMAGWDGVAEQEFMRQLDSCRARMAKTPALLDELASDLRATATTLLDGEHQASAAILNIVRADE